MLLVCQEKPGALKAFAPFTAKMLNATIREASGSVHDLNHPPV